VRHVDYQDVRLWRRFARSQVTRGGRAGVAVVPMTLVQPDVYEELTHDARVFLLTASRATLEHRIAQSADSQDWRTQNLDECLAAFESNDFGEHVATDGRTPGDVARSILQRLG
jgi:hypothetical protein